MMKQVLINASIILVFGVSCKTGFQKETAMKTDRGSTTTQGMELEYKFALTQNEYESLITHFRSIDNLETSRQENIYFEIHDPNDPSQLLLRSNMISLRLRLKGEKAIVTYKQALTNAEDASGDSSPLFKRKELECVAPIDHPAISLVLSNKITVLALDESVCPMPKDSKDPHPIRYFQEVVASGLRSANGKTVFVNAAKASQEAKNQTLRTKIPLTLAGERFTMELDKTFFPKSYVGYELELEVKDSQNGAVESDLLKLLKEQNITARPSMSSKSEMTFQIVQDQSQLIEDHMASGALIPKY